MIALQASSVLMWLVAAGFGIPAPFVASYFLIAIDAVIADSKSRIGHAHLPCGADRTQAPESCQ